MKPVRLILTILFALLYQYVYASMPSPLYRYSQYSINKTSFLYSIPFSKYTEVGKTTVYKSDSTKLYTIDKYLYHDAYLNDSGTLLYSFHPYATSMVDTYSVLSIYTNGKLSKKYTVTDFIQDTSFFKKIRSFSPWYKQTFVRNDTIFVVTILKHTILFNLNTGERLGVINTPKIIIGKIYTPNEHSSDYSAKYIIDYDSIPSLQNGKNFKKELMIALNKYSYEKPSTAIYLQILIDKYGNTEVYNMHSENIQDKIATTIQQDIEKWVKSIKMNVPPLPPDCDKWLFGNWVYLR